MPNDYEYLEDSQIPPVAPRPPTNAPADLITGLPNTPALKSNDDVDLESNRPRGNNNLSFSDGVNPKRSEPTLVGTKTSRSSESDEEAKESQKHEDRKPQKGGTCWYIFAGVTICLAVISLLGLGAFLLINGFTEENKPISGALNGTNETTSAPFETTTVMSVLTSSPKNNQSTVTKAANGSSAPTARPVVLAKGSSTVGVTEGSSTVTKGSNTSESVSSTTVMPQNITELPSTVASAFIAQNSTTQENATEPSTAKVVAALPSETTTPTAEAIKTSTSGDESTKSTGTSDIKTTEFTAKPVTDFSTTDIPSSTEDVEGSTTNTTSVSN